MVVERDKREKVRQKRNYDAHHGVTALPLLPGDGVYIQDRDSTGTVVRESTPRLYVAQTLEGTVCRNCRHMVKMESSNSQTA